MKGKISLKNFIQENMKRNIIYNHEVPGSIPGPAVSYTHLDVYKRQASYNVGSRRVSPSMRRNIALCAVSVCSKTSEKFPQSLRFAKSRTFTFPPNSSAEKGTEKLQTVSDGL